MSVAQAVMEIPAAHQLNVFGQFDCNIKKIERAFGVTFVNRVKRFVFQEQKRQLVRREALWIRCLNCHEEETL